MFENLDTWVLLRVERFCHLWQRLTSLTNFWWANLLLGVVPVGYACIPLSMLVRDMAPIPYSVRNIITPLFMTLGVLITLYVLLFVSLEMQTNKQLEKHYLSGNKTAHPTTLRRRFEKGAIRMLTSFVLIVLFGFDFMSANTNIFDWFLCGGLQCWWVALYCEACIPLPPRKSRVRQWWETLVARLLTVNSVAAS